MKPLSTMTTQTENDIKVSAFSDAADAANDDVNYADADVVVIIPSPLKSHKIPSREELLSCLVTLQSLVANNREGFEVLSKNEQIDLIRAAGIFSKPSKDELFTRKKQARKKKTADRLERNKNARAKTGIRIARTKDVFVAPLEQQRLLTHEFSHMDDNSNKCIKELEVTADEKKNGKETKPTTTTITNTQDQDSSRLDTPELTSYRNCYVCKAKYTKLHFFYDTMCLKCADFNYRKRFQTTDLSGQIALITGGRLKIGYQATLILLRSGATVIVTTRFPADAATRFSKEEDYGNWRNRLHIHGLDLRHTPSVELFCTYINQTYSRLDILINNAATTVQRPPQFYSHMIEHEHRPFHNYPPEVRRLLKSHYRCLNKLSLLSVGTENDVDDNNDYHDLSSTTDYDDVSMALTTGINTDVTWHNTKGPGIGLRASAQLSQIPYSYDGEVQQNQDASFPSGKLDVDLQQVDLRTSNSWRLKLGEISTMELLEVQLVNAIAPFVLCNRLAPMMKRSNTGCKHIVNVTAMEGKFYTFHKPTSRHPHTNMAKAALNMLTHTSSVELAKFGIYMNAVDTGWVTDEDPIQLATEKVKVHDFQPPLDIVDGAARVLDPIIDGCNRGEHWCGKFLKDYFPIDW